ncbi:MAG TPA: hypothetical protein VGF15_03435 [Solirubrobacteraceae bacterium]|jgi:hypothetical protein
MTLSALEQRILELARHTLSRRTIVQQCKLAGHTPLETTHALAGLLGARLLEQEDSDPYRPKPIHYTSTREGLEQLARQARPVLAQ